MYMNPFRFNPETDMGAEISDKPSETVPDMTLPLAEMLDRYTRGQPVELYQPLYDSDLPAEFEGLDIQKLTKLELLQLRDDIRNNIRTLQQAIADQNRKDALPVSPALSSPEPEPEPEP